jgi:hypothetical protein
MADDDDTEPTEAEVKKFNKLFHKAASERDKRLENSLLKRMDSMLGGKFDELRTALVDTSPDDDDDPDDPITPAQPTRSSGGQELTPEARAAIRRSEQTAKEAKERADKTQKLYEDSESRRKQSEERQALTGVLSPHVKPKILDIVVNQVHSRHLVREAETDNLLWKDENGDLLPLKDGAAAWAKSDVGKEFAPPVKAESRGGRGPDGNGAIQPGKMTMDDLGGIVTGSIGGANRNAH